jgi:hypothetical protein
MGVQRGKEPHHHGVYLNHPVRMTPDSQATDVSRLFISNFCYDWINALLSIDGSGRDVLAKVHVARSREFQPQRRSLLPDQNAHLPDRVIATTQ